jgi:hypothetical protein
MNGGFIALIHWGKQQTLIYVNVSGRQVKPV